LFDSEPEVVVLKRLLLALFLLFLPLAASANEPDRGAIIERLAKGIAATGAHRIYIPDFPDLSGQPSGLGAFLAATFSHLLTDRAKGFSTLDRAQAHSYLLKHNLTDYVLVDASNQRTFASQFEVDAILFGIINSADGSEHLKLTLLDLTGKNLFQDSYTEASNLTENQFPSGIATSGWPFYFPMLDGVSMPSCFYNPNPPIPPSLAKQRLSGNVLLDGLVNSQGKIESLRLIKSFDPRFNAISVETVKTWRCKPARDSDGNPVPIRVPFQLTFNSW
jgi:TonB family protein